MIRETKTDGVATMFTRLVKSISVVVLILVLASSVSLAGVGGVNRGVEIQRTNIASTHMLYSLLLSLRHFPIV